VLLLAGRQLRVSACQRGEGTALARVCECGTLSWRVGTKSWHTLLRCSVSCMHLHCTPLQPGRQARHAMAQESCGNEWQHTLVLLRG
jgi:hypothetical protein